MIIYKETVVVFFNEVLVMRKTIKMNSMFKSMLLMLCVAMVVAGTVLGSGIVEVQAATLSGYGLTKKESKEFTKILMSEAKREKLHIIIRLKPQNGQVMVLNLNQDIRVLQNIV